MKLVHGDVCRSLFLSFSLSLSPLCLYPSSRARARSLSSFAPCRCSCSFFGLLWLSRCMSLSLALYVSGGLCLSLLSCYYLATISLPSPGYLPGVCACEVYVNFSLKPACVRCVCGRGRGRGRVHRFPNNKELFCAILGNGSQLVGVCVGVLVLACLGVYSQVRSLLVREHIL